jgi:antitoxin component of RelBE/YafQ-DinJ toxin-antitoxin module
VEERMSKEDYSITLEDVEIAIKVVMYFYEKALKAKKVLEKFGVRRATTTSFPTSIDDVTRMLLQQAIESGAIKLSPTTPQIEVEDEGLTEQDVEKFKRLVEKIKAKEIKIE